MDVGFRVLSILHERQSRLCLKIIRHPKQLRHIKYTHLVEAAMNDGTQSCPKVAHGLTAYGPTSASMISRMFPEVPHHGGVEFDEIKEVWGFSNRLDVVIEPAREIGTAELYTI